MAVIKTYTMSGLCHLTHGKQWLTTSQHGLHRDWRQWAVRLLRRHSRLVSWSVCGANTSPRFRKEGSARDGDEAPQADEHRDLRVRRAGQLLHALRVARQVRQEQAVEDLQQAVLQRQAREASG